MREYKEEQKTVTRLVSTKCDLCGAVANDGYWESSDHEVDETDIKVTVRQCEGTSRPEFGSVTEYNVDMCPKCFKDKLIPWLESQGCTAETREWEW